MPEVGTLYYKDDPRVAHEVSKLISAEMVHIGYDERFKFRIRMENTIEVRERNFFLDLDRNLFIELEAWIKDNAFNRDNEVLKITVFKEGNVPMGGQN